MSDSGYTPTTAEVKSAWVGSKPNIGMLVVRDMHAAEFDRWLAANNAQVLADLRPRNCTSHNQGRVCATAPTAIKGGRATRFELWRGDDE